MIRTALLYVLWEGPSSEMLVRYENHCVAAVWRSFSAESAYGCSHSENSKRHSGGRCVWASSFTKILGYHSWSRWLANWRSHTQKCCQASGIHLESLELISRTRKSIRNTRIWSPGCQYTSQRVRTIVNSTSIAQMYA